MSVGSVLLDILVLLVAAKLAAEASERLHVPAVVGEIVAGVIIGPSALGLVRTSSVLATLGELGVILLLLEVGMSMRLDELTAVGRASLLVATIGVIVPMATGLGVGLAFGHDFDVSLFLGAALAATSVGITARVFSDLRALATVEARTVLGAAVADDVMGLVVLTVVVRIATGSSISVLDVIGIVAVALGFLVVTTLVGQRLGPGLFAFVDRFARSAGTMVAIALAFTLAFAKLADAAKLAPIVGAFVAGVSLSESAQRERIERELRPVGHLFIPVFFLEIGIDARVQEFIRPSVLGIAAALLVVAVLGKIVAALGSLGSPGDKLLIGLGMIPRGEVGLIFASIGLQDHVLGRDLYAALLLVVLVSTVATPPLLRWRLLRRRSAAGAGAAGAPKPREGWLVVRDGTVELTASPPERVALHLGLETGLLLVDARPDSALLDWFGRLDPEQHLRWDRDATGLLFRVLLEGNARSWRFLETTGLLERALPELAAALARRRADPFLVDPGQILRFALIEEVREQTRSDERVRAWREHLTHPEWLLLAALILDTAGGDAPIDAARALAKRLDLGAAGEQEVALLVGEHELLRAAAERVDAFDEEVVLQLATHLETPERTCALAILSAALGSLSAEGRERLDTLVALVLTALEQSALTGLDARNLVESRRRQAAAALGERTPEADRVLHAPRAYLLAQDVPTLVRQARLMEPLAPRGHARVRVSVLPAPSDLRIEIATRDRPGLLATVTGVFADLELEVIDAFVATWPDGGALEAFHAYDRRWPDREQPSAELLERAILDGFGAPISSIPEPNAQVVFDDRGSPWYTLCEVRTADRPGLLHDITAGFAIAGASVHSASATTKDGQAIDRFELTDPDNRKLDDTIKRAVSTAIGNGVSTSQRDLRRARRRLFGRR